MIYINYEGALPSLLLLNNCVVALESTLEHVWSNDSMVRARSSSVDERAFLRRLEQCAPAKRRVNIQWQDQKRIDYAIISLRFQSMVDQVAQAIEPVRQAADAVYAEVMQPGIDANVITAEHDLAWNNYSYALALAASTTDLVNRYRTNHAGDELMVTCLKALRDNYTKLPRLTLSHVLDESGRDDRQMPSSGSFFSTCHIAPMTVANPSFDGITDLVARCRKVHAQTYALIHALVTEVKGTLNEKNYQVQLAEAVSEPYRFDKLRREQQLHRSNYESVRIACRVGIDRLQGLLSLLCERFETVRKQPLPDAQVDRDRLYAAGFIVYWLVMDLFMWTREQSLTIWEDPTKGAGKLDNLFAEAMTEATSLASVDIKTRRCWYSDSWKRGHAFAYLQNFGNEKLLPVQND